MLQILDEYLYEAPAEGYQQEVSLNIRPGDGGVKKYLYFTSRKMPVYSRMEFEVQVDSYLTWVSNQIDMQFQQAGYIVPFVELSGETFPAHQTQYLSLLCALGSAAYAGGWVLKPAPAVARGRDGSTGNVFQDLYEKELTKIWDNSFNRTTIRFRVMAYSGTPAEQSISEPTAPSLDYIEGVMNPEDLVRLEAYTDLRYGVERSVIADSVISPNFWGDFSLLYTGKSSGYPYNDNSG